VAVAPDTYGVCGKSAPRVVDKRQRYDEQWHPGRTARQLRQLYAGPLRRGRPPQPRRGVRTGSALALRGPLSPAGSIPISDCRHPGPATLPTTQLAPRQHIAVAQMAERAPDLPPGVDPVPERHR